MSINAYIHYDMDYIIVSTDEKDNIPPYTFYIEYILQFSNSSSQDHHFK